MEIFNLSRNELDIAINNNTIDESSTFIISLYDFSKEPISTTFENNMKVFKCIDYDSERHLYYGEEASIIVISYFEDNPNKLFSRRDSKDIINEVKLLSKDITKLIVQCETGKTASAAVSAILDLYLNNELNSRFVNHNLYKNYYNKSIYNTMLSVL